jgi:hypothetical protein
MDGLHLEAAADRVCAGTGGELRCWDPPRENDRGPQKRQPDEWLTPRGPAPAAGVDPLYGTWVGTGAACAGVREGLRCFGDGTFGLIGAHSDAATRSGIVGGVPEEPFLEIGRYHACAERKGGGDVYCWGRDDVGQLGASPVDVCEFGRDRVPCARTAQKAAVVPSHAFFKLGDLFTCAGGPNGVSCWGASRDGFFDGDPCPENLRRAWPGLNGPLAAPNARCSVTPRPVQSATGFFPTLILYFEAGPRGICSTYLGGLRCSGAIPTPPLTGLRNIRVSPGDDASACATDLGGVACWGEAYSPPGSPAQPVLIAFEPVFTAGAAIAADSSKEEDWGPGCAIHGRCRLGSPTWPYCPPCVEARSWSDVAAHAAELVGQRIRVRGPLGLEATRVTTLLECESDDPRRPCCNGVSTRVVLGGGDGAIQVGPYGCAGDESRLCCSAPALGESVVVTGRLGPGSGTAKLGLFEVEACVDR